MCADIPVGAESQRCAKAPSWRREGGTTGGAAQVEWSGGYAMRCSAKTAGEGSRAQGVDVDVGIVGGEMNRG